jgi:hypothetical protein
METSDWKKVNSYLLRRCITGHGCYDIDTTTFVVEFYDNEEFYIGKGYDLDSAKKIVELDIEQKNEVRELLSRNSKSLNKKLVNIKKQYSELKSKWEKQNEIYKESRNN